MPVSLVIVLGVLAVFLSLFLVCAVGAADISINDVFRVFGDVILGRKTDPVSIRYIVWDLRLPRAIGAIVIGGGLAVAGACMQAVTKNVMADSYVLGISSGALAFVSVGAYIGGMTLTIGWQTSVLAFVGSLVAVFLVIAVGGSRGNTGSAKLILTGQAVSITLNAVAQYFIYSSVASNKSASIVTWMMGSLAGIRWGNLWICVVGIIVCTVLLMAYSRAFDLMALGDDTASTLGVNVSRVKKFSLVLVALITGFAVSSSGIIGLVGFMIPHIVRFFVGSVHKRLFPVAFLVGGFFLMWMDVLARTLLDPQEVPIGIFTALCGGPFFIWIIRGKMKGGK